MYGCSISELHGGAQLCTYVYWKAKNLRVLPQIHARCPAALSGLSAYGHWFFPADHVLDVHGSACSAASSSCKACFPTSGWEKLFPWVSELHVAVHAQPCILCSIVDLLGINQCYSRVESLEQSIVECRSFQLVSCIGRFHEPDEVDEGMHLVSRHDLHGLCDDSPSCPDRLMTLETEVS